MLLRSLILLPSPRLSLPLRNRKRAAAAVCMAATQRRVDSISMRLFISVSEMGNDDLQSLAASQA